jgi:long-subunit fatty acid transport protein
MIKKIIVSLCLLISFTALAQEGTSSAYSFYGIGDIRFKGTVDTRAMGGISVFPDSIHINIQNPAQLASLKYTTFGVAGTYNTTNYKTETQEQRSKRTTLDYFAVGIPAGKLGFAIALYPYSSVGYKIQNISSGATPVFSRYGGVGGVNRVFAGAGYQLTKKINIGVDIQYNFGTIETTSLRFINTVQYGTREKNNSNLQGLNADFGMTYQTKLKGNRSFFSSLTYTPQSEMKLNNARSIEIIQFLNSGAVGVIESEDINVEDTNIKIPSKLTFGTGYGRVKNWLIGGEISLIENSVMSNRFNDIDDAYFENTVRYNIGGYFIPNYNSYSNYFKRVTYRAGLRYENTGLVIQNKSITDFAGTFGLGLPINGTFSNINIAVEIGKRGTKYNNLVEENYINFVIGLSFNDKWFEKRKFY